MQGMKSHTTTADHEVGLPRKGSRRKSGAFNNNWVILFWTRPGSQGRPQTMEIDKRTSFIGPAGVVAMACTHRRPDATRETPAGIAVGINWQLARDRPDRVSFFSGLVD